MADTKFRGNKWENNPNKISWTGYNSRKRCLAVPYPNAKQGAGPPQQHVIPKHREKNLELILPKNTKKFHKMVEKINLIGSIDQIYITACARQ